MGIGAAKWCPVINTRPDRTFPAGGVGHRRRVEEKAADTRTMRGSRIVTACKYW
jgi:hypothetical protein